VNERRVYLVCLLIWFGLALGWSYFGGWSWARGYVVLAVVSVANGALCLHRAMRLERAGG
jgi:hypothetical protein